MHEATKMVRTEELMRLLLAGYMMKECAKQMSMNYATIRKYASEPSFMAQLKELNSEVYSQVDSELKLNKAQITERLEDISEKALDTLESLLDATAPAPIRFKAAQDLLDRNPQVSRTKKIEADTKHNFLNPLHLVHAAQAAQEMDEYKPKQIGDGNAKP
jgi:phosphoribosylaminoimidazole carboxylase (NCAIR synthetase)